MRRTAFDPNGGADWRGPGGQMERNRPGAGAACTIPAGRMKAGREHRVPLAPRCIELLKQAKILAAGSEFVFPGRSGRKPMSNMVLLMIMRRLESDATVHGFRSAFRDWASERTNFAREICEAAHAHIVKDKTEAAYRRGDLFDIDRASAGVIQMGKL